jgi:hypothetical protein
MYAKYLAWLLASLCCSACGRIGVEVVAYDPSVEDAARADMDEDASQESDPDASLEPDSAQTDDATASSGALDAGDAGGQVTDGATPADAASVPDSSLFLRYDFSGSGTVVSDRIGSNHGEALGGAQLDGSGALFLDGTNDFVNMPNGLLSRWSSVTVMAWLTWSGGPCWQRIFDFGSSSNGEDNAGDATSAFSLSPGSCPNAVATGLFELNSDLRAVNGNAISVGVPTQVALSLDSGRGTLTLFMNGAVVGESAVPWQLSQLQDVNNWLGRSQWVQDKFLHAQLDELRIYSTALTSSEVAALRTRGPDAP